jgi:hypothetical protein
MAKTSKRIDKVPWSLLTPLQQLERERALDVLRDMRRYGRPLKSVMLPTGMTENKVIEHIRSALRKRGDTWLAIDHDSISRGLNIIEKDIGWVSIEVNSSSEASKAGKYRYVVGQFIDTGDTTRLAEFKGKTITDSHGIEHPFETDPKKVMDALKRTSKGIYEVYD